MENTLSIILRKKREELDLTLRDVQSKTGISNAYLSQLEHGKVTHPTPSILQKLAKCYQVPYGRLLELAGHPTVSESEQVIQFRTSSGLEELNEEEEKELLEYLRFIRIRRREK
jgi:transcriptional regulator with XRE-family HTH domain